MKLLGLLLLITTFTVSANDLLMNFSHFSDDGGEHKLTTFKIDASSLVKNSELSCSFRGIDHEDFVEFSVLSINGVFVATASENNSDHSNSNHAGAIARNFTDIFAAYDSGDGYVSRSIIIGSKAMTNEYLNLLNSFEEPEDKIELKDIKEMKFNEMYSFNIANRKYEASCELNLEDDL